MKIVVQHISKAHDTQPFMTARHDGLSWWVPATVRCFTRWWSLMTGRVLLDPSWQPCVTGIRHSNLKKSKLNTTARYTKFTLACMFWNLPFLFHSCFLFVLLFYDYNVFHFEWNESTELNWTELNIKIVIIAVLSLRQTYSYWKCIDPHFCVLGVKWWL